MNRVARPGSMKILILLSVIAYVIACCLPALQWKDDNKPVDIMLGLRALAVGWSGIFAGVVAWYANPLWAAALGLAFFRKPLFGAIAGMIAFGIALTVFKVVGRELPADEGNVVKTRIIAVLPGAYVWFVSIGLSILAAVMGAKK